MCVCGGGGGGTNFQPTCAAIPVLVGLNFLSCSYRMNVVTFYIEFQMVAVSLHYFFERDSPELCFFVPVLSRSLDARSQQ